MAGFSFASESEAETFYQCVIECSMAITTGTPRQQQQPQQFNTYPANRAPPRPSSLQNIQTGNPMSTTPPYPVQKSQSLREPGTFGMPSSSPRPVADFKPVNVESEQPVRLNKKEQKRKEKEEARRRKMEEKQVNHLFHLFDYDRLVRTRRAQNEVEEEEEWKFQVQ